MPQQISLCVTLNNHDVYGILNILSTGRICVEMTQPYTGTYKSKALSFFTRLPNDQNFSNAELAVEQGKHLLRQLYHDQLAAYV